MKVKLITVGTQMPQWVTEGFNEYQKRLQHSLKLDLIEIPLPTRHKNTPVEKLKIDEALKIKKYLQPQDYVVALDENGKLMTTRQLADFLEKQRQLSQDIAIVIGGPDGLDPSILSSANAVCSLSRFTLPHPLVRIIIAEQLYRAQMIITNHPYHRD